MFSFADLTDQMISSSTPEIDTQTEITSESTSFENEVGFIVGIFFSVKNFILQVKIQTLAVMILIRFNRHLWHQLKIVLVKQRNFCVRFGQSVKSICKNGMHFYIPCNKLQGV